MTKRRMRHLRKSSWLGCIPHHVWILVEVLATILVLHYVHIPVSDILPLIKLFTQGT
jgi:hypothetical protein